MYFVNQSSVINLIYSKTLILLKLILKWKVQTQVVWVGTEIASVKCLESLHNNCIETFCSIVKIFVLSSHFELFQLRNKEGTCDPLFFRLLYLTLQLSCSGSPPPFDLAILTSFRIWRYIFGWLCQGTLPKRDGRVQVTSA